MVVTPQIKETKEIGSFVKSMSKWNILQMIKENGDERKDEDAKKMKQIWKRLLGPFLEYNF